MPEQLDLETEVEKPSRFVELFHELKALIVQYLEYRFGRSAEEKPRNRLVGSYIYSIDSPRRNPIVTADLGRYERLLEERGARYAD